MEDPILEVLYTGEDGEPHIVRLADCLFESAEAWLLEHMGIAKEQIIYIVRVPQDTVNQRKENQCL